MEEGNAGAVLELDVHEEAFVGEELELERFDPRAATATATTKRPNAKASQNQPIDNLCIHRVNARNSQEMPRVCKRNSKPQLQQPRLKLRHHAGNDLTHNINTE